MAAQRRGALFPALLLAALLGASCGRRGAQGGALYAPSASGDPLGDHIARVRSELESRGFRPLAEPQRGDLAADGQLARPVEIRQAGCFVFVALGGPGIADLDLYLVDASMRRIGRDTRRDAHPWVVHCATGPGRIVVRVRAYRGQGPYLLAVFQGAEHPGDLSGVVSAGLLAMPPPAVDADAAERIAASDVEQSRIGGVRAGRPITLRMTRREIRPIPVRLSEGACYSLASFGGEGVRDTDLFLLAPDGSEMLRDDRRARDAIVRLCASAAGTYQLRVKANRGDGQVYVLAYGADGTDVIAHAGDVEPEATAEGGAPAGPGSPADESFRALDSDVRARGYEPIGEPVIGDVVSGEPLVFELPLEADRCYAVAAATTGDGEIDVHLKTLQGDSIEAEVSAGAAAIVRACARGSGPHRIEVDLRRGGGPVVARAYLWPRSTRGPFGLQGVPFVRLAEASSLLALEGYEPLGAPESSDLRQGRGSSYDVTFESQVCHAVVGVGGLGVDEVDLEVTANGRSVATDTSDGPIAIAQVCPPAPEGLKVEVRAARGAGRVLYQLFQGPEQ